MKTYTFWLDRRQQQRLLELVQQEVEATLDDDESLKDLADEEQQLLHDLETQILTRKGAQDQSEDASGEIDSPLRDEVATKAASPTAAAVAIAGKAPTRTAKWMGWGSTLLVAATLLTVGFYRLNQDERRPFSASIVMKGVMDSVPHCDWVLHQLCSFEREVIIDYPVNGDSIAVLPEFPVYVSVTCSENRDISLKLWRPGGEGEVFQADTSSRMSLLRSSGQTLRFKPGNVRAIDLMFGGLSRHIKITTADPQDARYRSCGL